MKAEHRRAIDAIETAQRALLAHAEALAKPRAPRERAPKAPRITWQSTGEGPRWIEVPGVAKYVPSEYEEIANEALGRVAAVLFLVGLSGLYASWRMRERDDKRFAFVSGVAGLIVVVVSLFWMAKSQRADALREARVLLRRGIYLLPDGLLRRGSGPNVDATLFVPRDAITAFEYRPVRRRVRQTCVLWRDADGDEKCTPVFPVDVSEPFERWRRGDASVSATP